MNYCPICLGFHLGQCAGLAPATYTIATTNTVNTLPSEWVQRLEEVEAQRRERLARAEGLEGAMRQPAQKWSYAALQALRTMDPRAYSRIIAEIAAAPERVEDQLIFADDPVPNQAVEIACQREWVIEAERIQQIAERKAREAQERQDAERRRAEEEMRYWAAMREAEAAAFGAATAPKKKSPPQPILSGKPTRTFLED
jgi:hypothetical protein